MNLDQSDDLSNKELYALLHDTNVPDYVKKSDLLTVPPVNKEAFADSAHRRFPVNSPENTYISNMFFQKNAGYIRKKWGKFLGDSIEEKLNKSAKLFDIEEDIKNYNASRLQKINSDYETKPVSEIDVNGVSYSLFPYKTAEDLSYSANLFVNSLAKFPFHLRVKIAKDFVKAGERKQIERLPNLIYKYAGEYFPNLYTLKAKLTHRFSKISSLENRELYQHLIDISDLVNSKQGVFDVVKLAYEIEASDGLYDSKYRSDAVGDIVETIFDMSPEKVANAFEAIAMAGQLFPICDLKKVSPEVYKEAFGIDIDPGDENNLKEVLPTMPRSDVALFKELCNL